MTRSTPRLLALSCAMLLPIAACAAPAAETSAGSTDALQAATVDTDAMAKHDFDALVKMAANHPNELHRIHANKAAASGDWGDAARHFRIAARHADKYSQHRLSMLYWHGVGVAADRVEAYIWADLAAERGYPQFLAIREKMWGALTLQQQAAVPARGRAFFDEYADAAAKPRVERAIAQGLRQRTGSHTGFDAGLIISSIGPGNQLFGSVGGVNLKQMYDASRTDPKKYWAFEDMVWKNGMVKVGEIENVPTERVPADAATPDAGKPEAHKP
jgi:uncharacterized protein